MHAAVLHLHHAVHAPMHAAVLHLHHAVQCMHACMPLSRTCISSFSPAQSAICSAAPACSRSSSARLSSSTCTPHHSTPSHDILFHPTPLRHIPIPPPSPLSTPLPPTTPLPARLTHTIGMSASGHLLTRFWSAGAQEGEAGRVQVWRQAGAWGVSLGRQARGDQDCRKWVEGGHAGACDQHCQASLRRVAD